MSLRVKVVVRAKLAACRQCDDSERFCYNSCIITIKSHYILEAPVLVNNTSLVELPCFENPTGSLVAIEGGQTVDFDFQRIYYIFGTNATSHRGFHAHRKLKQLLICVSGSVDIIVDDGTTREVVTLDTPRVGLRIGSLVWREMKNFSEGAVLLVLASEHYDMSDYIRDYDELKAAAQQCGRD